MQIRALTGRSILKGVAVTIVLGALAAGIVIAIRTGQPGWRNSRGLLVSPSIVLLCQRRAKI